MKNLHDYITYIEPRLKFNEITINKIRLVNEFLSPNSTDIFSSNIQYLIAHHRYIEITGNTEENGDICIEID
jgi:hypothetical protein